MRLEFDWDPAKASANLTKHQVSFEGAMTVFSDPLALTVPDADALTGERWVTIWLSRDTRLLLEVRTHGEIAEDHTDIRIISARPPTKRESRQYEQ